MIRLRTSLFLIFLLRTLTAQEPLFIPHDIGDFNSAITVNTMYQDHQCMIWLGTDQGLLRFDGINTYTLALDNGSKKEITSLYEDRQNRLWVGTSAGEIFYLDHFRKPHPFEPEEGHPAKRITAIVEDKSGQIWFATYGEGVYLYTGKRIYNFDEADGLSGNEIYTMTYTPGGEIWLGTDDGINICTFENERKEISSLGLADGLPDQIITSLISDEHGNVWIGTFESGIVYYNASLQKISRPFDAEGIHEITSFEIFDGVELWIGTRKSGAWRYHPQTGLVRKVTSLQSVRKGEISSILADVEGNIWISFEEGFIVSGHRPFESFTTAIGEIQALFIDHKDKLWIGTKNGLYRADEKQHLPTATELVPATANWNITDIVEDPFHNLWIGTLDKGLYIYHPISGKTFYVGAHHTALSNTVMSMSVAKDKIWIATLQGVLFYPTDKNILLDQQLRFQLINDPWNSSLHFVFQVFVDSKDRAWFATDGNGVYCIHGDSVQHFTGNDSILLNSVYSVCEDHQGHLWFNTTDQGLVEFDGHQYKRLNSQGGLVNMAIASMATAGNGDLLLAHNRGVDLLEPERRHFMYYDTEIGARDIDAGLNAVTTDSKGNIYISGRDKIIKYYSSKNPLSIHPCTKLMNVTVYQNPVDFASVHHFPYNKNYISFEYAGLWYTSPQSVKYLYKLEGYDLHWKESKDNVASYSNLSPGTYTFYVKASENNFFLDEPIDSYTFTIERPFWQMPWFVALFTLVAAAIFYFIIKSRERRSERQATIKKDMIESQLQTLKAQINPHFLFNSFNTLITIIDENADKPAVAIEYVEKLSDFFRSVLQYREQETITLEEEWQLVKNYGYLLQKRYGSNLRLHMDQPPKDALILPLTLQMLVENAVKHNVISETKPLDVFINIEDGFITVVNNLQPKSKPEVSTQFGLQSIIKRYQLMSDKKVIVEKTDNTFKVSIPVIKSKEL